MNSQKLVAQERKQDISEDAKANLRSLVGAMAQHLAYDMRPGKDDEGTDLLHATRDSERENNPSISYNEVIKRNSNILSTSQCLDIIYSFAKKYEKETGTSLQSSDSRENPKLDTILPRSISSFNYTDDATEYSVPAD